MFHIIGHCKQIPLVTFSSPDNPDTALCLTCYGPWLYSELINVNPLMKILKVFSYPLIPNFRNSIAFWKFPRLWPLVLLSKVVSTRRWVWSICGILLTGENCSTRRKVWPSPTFPIQIAHGLGWNRTRTSAVRNGQLTARAVAGPSRLRLKWVRSKYWERTAQ